MQSVRLITEFVQNPRLHIDCSQSCPQFAEAEIAPGGDVKEALVEFVQAATKEGWIIGLLGNICPAHVQKLKAPSIIVPSGRVN